ncbi:MAG: hypothetical protein KME01_02885 [Chroococcus sp. CMT-3BRIN-NPC107]|jgi:hypothetical protein|nr:hypothetical protein [Chroococcus sp. CMT-3BRIN-NPC107]
MINILKKRWQRVAWFIASLLTVMLFSFTSNQVSPTTAAASAKTVVKSSFSSAAFKQVAASHLEPNFYQ